MSHPADKHLPDRLGSYTETEAFRLGYEACQRDQGKGTPTISEVEAYCKERGNSVNPQQWYDHYLANGWKVGKVPMKNWKAAVRCWERSNFNTQPQREMRLLNV